ncbi:uncharacterized protein [Clytia hemisphaerica]|uniref:uncharacterized protein n=1 Tax=Clytia hemisphaerica TaxID=252671 RepID=UPI0034D4A8EC
MHQTQRMIKENRAAQDQTQAPTDDHRPTSRVQKHHAQFATSPLVPLVIFHHLVQTAPKSFNTSHAERSSWLHLLNVSRSFERNYCMQCLFPGAEATTGKHAEGRCQRDFVCPHPSHRRYDVKKHFLVCEEHKSENDQLLAKYVQRFIRNPSLPEFAHNLSLTLEESECHKIHNQDCMTEESRLTTLNVDGKKLLVFFDSGCSDFIISKSAVKLLGARCSQESSNPISLGGVGNCSTKSTLGSYRVKLPLFDGDDVLMSGPCLERITSIMPTYPLDEVFKDIQRSYTISGATIRDSVVSVSFQDSSGRRGVVGGPHKVFTNVHQYHHVAIHPTVREVKPQLPLLGYQPDSTSAFLSTSMKVFEEVEGAGSEIDYRCPKCRGCKDCKHDSSNETISIKEEVEQSLINSSVKIDFDQSISSASLPFIADPTTRLANNKDKAMKVYIQQLKKLNQPSNLADKEDILQSEGKLQKLGYVEFVRNLPQDVQSRLHSSPIHYFIPWRAVWKGNSLSTPCRIVFDASQSTSSGYSLNDILAKGRNNLNRLQEILIRWSVQPVGMHQM